ncbi:hypothetical protein BCR37DRAFT_384465 [Protomyces lactucae-debilis]|uniref:Uncharacterized protein n=1 Tax=Protomyces lactucae-debilis TaxID=2754530 RepID=A0A1Y2ERY4_PROLT|nr:uncharacterized protein BCR37DRAFT_384465 [Protomyces lactucae-debilis]ORY74353.1 hypothetical protein BCR37DRAFT_384465 [Protomyces lactucae-debilis]
MNKILALSCPLVIQHLLFLISMLHGTPLSFAMAIPNPSVSFISNVQAEKANRRRSPGEICPSWCPVDVQACKLQPACGHCRNLGLLLFPAAALSSSVSFLL